MMLSNMVSNAFIDCEFGIGVRYRTEAKLLNTRWLQAVTKVRETLVRDFLFANHCAINASYEQEMQAGMDSFSSS